MAPSKSRFAYSAASLLSLFTFYVFLFSDRKPEVLHHNQFGLVNGVTLSSRFAVATFLSGDDQQRLPHSDPSEDYYYTATRMLTYQLVHAPETRLNSSIAFIVLVSSTISEHKKSQLKSDGALVVEAEDVQLRWWIKTGVTRWKDQFTKLRLFQMVEYDRILFIDADTLVLGPLDDIFDEPEVRAPTDTLFSRQDEVKRDERPLPAQYVFAARSDNALTGERDHPFPPLQTELFSAGFWIAAPSWELFEYFMSVMQHYRRFDPHTMEQSLLNYAFRRNGAMPWRELHYKWSATWPGSKDLEGGVLTLHEKFWKTGPRELQDIWWDQKRKMEAHFSLL